MSAGSVRPSEAKTSAGYALVLVLIGVAVLSLAAGTIAVISARSASRVSKDMLQAQLQCAAQAGVSEAILALSGRRPADQWKLDGSAQNISFRGIPVAVSITSEMGKVDLNGADATLLSGLLTAAGLDQSDAGMFAARILDWREPGGLKRLNGAKAADYQAAGLPYRPRGGPFQTIDELNLVLGMTPGLYALLAPDITVYSGLASPQWQAAPPLVLQAMGMDPATIEVIMAARGRDAIAAQTLPTSSGAARALPGAAFTIIATARQNGIIASRAETVRFTGTSARPFWVLCLRQ